MTDDHHAHTSPDAPFTISLNGEQKALEGATQKASIALGALLEEELGLTAEARGVAVAVNDAVVPKSQWYATMIERGDRVEVIRATQGG